MQTVWYSLCYLSPIISDKPIFVCQSISHLELKVLELSTGKNKVEEWTFLPAKWDHELVGRPIFDKNFVLLDFDHSGNFEFTDTGDILILNLVNRTKFWMRTETLMTQVKEKVAGRIDLQETRNWYFRVRKPYQMNVEKDRIVVNCHILEKERYSLGWFSHSYIL